VPVGAGSAAASVGRKRAVDCLAVGVKVASPGEGAVASVGWERLKWARSFGCAWGRVDSVGWERLKWKRSFGCARGRIDGVGIGDAEAVREYEFELFAIRERFCSAKTGSV